MHLLFLSMMGLWGFVGYVFGLHCPFWAEIPTAAAVIWFLGSWHCRQFELYGLVICARWIAFLFAMLGGDLAWLWGHSANWYPGAREFFGFLVGPGG